MNRLRTDRFVHHGARLLSAAFLAALLWPIRAGAAELSTATFCRGPIRIGTVGNYPPYVFQPDTDDKPRLTGLDFELILKIKTQLCKTGNPTLWVMTVPSIDDALDRLKSRDFDMLVGGFSTAEPIKGRGGLYYSHPYTQSKLVLARKRGSDADEIFKQAESSGATRDWNAFARVLRTAKVKIAVEEKSYAEAVLKSDLGLNVVAGKAKQLPDLADVIAIDAYSVPLLTQDRAGWEADIPAHPIAQTGVSIVFRDSDGALVRAVNKIIDDLSFRRDASGNTDLDVLVSSWTQWDKDPDKRTAQISQRFRTLSIQADTAENLSAAERWRLEENRMSVELDLPGFVFDTKGGHSSYKEQDFSSTLAAIWPLKFAGGFVTAVDLPAISVSRKRYQDTTQSGIQKEDIWTIGLGARLRPKAWLEWLPDLKPDVRVSWGNRQFQDQFPNGGVQPAKNSFAVTQWAVDLPLLSNFQVRSFALAPKLSYKRISEATTSGARFGNIDQTVGLNIAITHGTSDP